MALSKKRLEDLVNTYKKDDLNDSFPELFGKSLRGRNQQNRMEC